MYSLETRRRRDRKRKQNLVLCHCSLCKGTYCSAKRASRHKNVFTNSTDIDSSESSSEEYTFSGDAESGAAHDVSETSNSAEESEHEKNGLEEEVNNSEEYEDIFEMSGKEMCSSPTNLSVDSIASLSYHDTRFNSDVEDQSSSSDTDHTTDLDSEPTSAPNDSDLSSLETESDVETDVRSRLPLYEGSSKTVLETLGGYFYWFSSHPSISKNALSSLLYHEHYNVLREGNNLPSSYQQAYDFIKPNLLPTECYHACPNDCILFRKTDRYDYSALKNCPKCNGDRYTTNGKPVRRFFYYPLGPRFKRLYDCRGTSSLLQEHSLRSNAGLADLMYDIHDSPTWHAAYAEDGPFKGDARGISLQFSTDGVNPFSVNKISYSMWPIMVTVLNLPKTCRNNFENVMLAGIIPANNKEEPKSVDPYVEVLVDELLGLCETTFYDGFREEEFLFRLQLHNYVLDYPGLNKVFCCAGSGALQGCMWCDERGEPVIITQLKSLGYRKIPKISPPCMSPSKCKPPKPVTQNCPSTYTPPPPPPTPQGLVLGKLPSNTK